MADNPGEPPDTGRQMRRLNNLPNHASEMDSLHLINLGDIDD